MPLPRDPSGMTREHLLPLQGRLVNVALADRSRLDGALLAGVIGEQIWLHAHGEDVFVAFDEVLDVWEVPGPASRSDAGAPVGD